MNEIIQNDRKLYSNEWVVMQNNILECFKSMSIDEKRLILIASPIARTIDATEQDIITFSASDYAKECGIDVYTAYKQLEEASRNLLKRTFSFFNENGRRVGSNWVIDCVYEEASINIRFTKFVLLMLKQLDKFNPYTKYKKEIALQLKNTYSIDLYHLLKKNQHKVVFNLSIDELNQEMGFPESYDRMDNLKRFFLLPTIEEINEKTDILVSYENVKQGRKVIAFRFTVKYKTTVAQEVEEVLKALPVKKKTRRRKGLTDKQIAKIAIYKNEFVDRNKHMIQDPNADYYQAFESFKDLLTDPETVNQFNDIELFLSVKKGDSLPAQQENNEINQEDKQDNKEDNKENNPQLKKRGRPKKIKVIEKDYSIDNLTLGDLGVAKSMIILVKNKRDNETIEQTHERIKNDY